MRKPSILRGVLQGAAAGAFAGLLDVGRALGSSHEVLQPHHGWKVVLFYAGWFAPLGAAAVLVARRFAWPFRMLDLLLAGGAVWFFVTAWINVAALDGFTSPLSIFVDLLLFAAAAGLVTVRYRSPGADATHGGRWALLAIASLGIAALFGFVLPPRGEGDAPLVRGPAGGKPRPNVLVVLVDTLRADHLSFHGYAKPTSPEFDAFAKDAVAFNDARAVTSWTKPSVASLFTSMYPTTHACIEQRDVLVPEAVTISETFRAAGWRTAAFVDNPFVSEEFGLGQGFERFEGVAPSVVVNGTLLGKALFMTRVLSLAGRPFGVGVREERGAAHLHERALAFADEARKDGRPFFAYVHAMEPHLPYVPARADAEAMGFPKGEEYAEPPRYNGILPFQTTPEPDPAFRAKLVAQYDGEIRGWSREFGKLVDGLRARGMLDDTVVVVLADHGEEFCEHGGWTHGHSLHREVISVPLVIRAPDAVAPAASRGRRIRGIATLLDVGPTLTELCGIEDPRIADPQRSGRSLLAQVLGTGPRPDAIAPRPVLAEVTMTPVSLRSIRDGSLLAIRAKAPLQESVSAYEDERDPRHRKDVAVEQATETRRALSLMDDLFTRLAAAALLGGARDLDAGTIEALRRLGYVGGK
ncbi:MAG: hypothetical protein HMLKMBBP_00161 [Planctomycetes bacterium]|nr:hypothetical protein [Planctomycetota bacterium]